MDSGDDGGDAGGDGGGVGGGGPSRESGEGGESSVRSNCFLE